MIITSKTNKIIVEMKKLRQSKYRKKEGLFIAEGEKNVIDSIKNGKLSALFHIEDVKIPDGIRCPVYTVTENVMKELCDTVTPQGIAGIFEIPVFSADKTGGNILALNGVSDPGNTGTILRTALAMGYNTVICDRGTADVYSPKVVRSAMSAIFSLNIMKTDDLKNELLRLKNSGYTVFCGFLNEKSEDLGNICFPERNIIVMGNEGSGADSDILSVSDKTYIIPMPGGTESLNVAVAAGITMYAAVKGIRT